MNLLQALNGKTKIWAGIALLFIVIASATTFMIFQKIQATETYYVLNQDVAATENITVEMLQERTVSQGGAPYNALDVGDVQTGEVHATYNLTIGDIITPSNTGPAQELTEGIPDEFVLASIELDPKNAVAGYVQRGDYIDLIAVGESVSADGSYSSSKYVIKNALVTSIDVFGSDAAAATVNDPNASETATARTVGNTYTLALPPLDAATLALVKDQELLMVLSPRTYLKEGTPNTYLGITPSEVFGIGNIDGSGYCTDPFFGNLTEQDVNEAQTNDEPLPIKPECSIPEDIFGYEIDEDGNIIEPAETITDEDGNIVDEDGNIINENPEDTTDNSDNLEDTDTGNTVDVPTEEPAQ